MLSTQFNPTILKLIGCEIKDSKSEKQELIKKKFQEMKDAGACPSESSNPDFNLANNIKKDLQDEQLAEEIAKHFSAVSQEYKPLKVEDLPLGLKVKINEKSAPIQVSPHKGFDVFKKRRHKNSKVPHNIPPKITMEFYPELAMGNGVCHNSPESTFTRIRRTVETH